MVLLIAARIELLLQTDLKRRVQLRSQSVAVSCDARSDHLGNNVANICRTNQRHGTRPQIWKRLSDVVFKGSLHIRSRRCLLRFQLLDVAI